MILIIVILTLLVMALGGLMGVLIFSLWSVTSQELDRPPTKEEWKEGKRERTWI